MAKIGFQWYVKYCYQDEILQEYTFDSLEAVQEAVTRYLENSHAPRSACGIMKVEDDEGYIRILEHIVVPTTTYWGEWEDE